MSVPKKPRRGRPPLAPKDRHSARIEIKATAADLKRWQTAADREGQSLSEWLRAAAELAVARGATR